MRPAQGDLWVFGYGSLMWDPGFVFEEQVPARLHGWHRRFTLESTESWGTAEVPGLCLVLHPGGSTLGCAFRVAASRVESTVAGLDRRENAYRRRVLAARAGDGRRLECLTYVWDPEHARFVGDLPLPERARRLHAGRGRKGTSLEYLHRTVEWLSAQGVADSSMHAELHAVRRWARSGA